MMFLSSKEWESQQYMVGVKGSSVEAGQREYRLLIVARGELDERVKAHTQMLLEEAHLWRIVPVTHRTEKTGCLAFRMASQGLGYYERNIARKHESPEFLLLLSLEIPSLAKHLVDLNPCMQGPGAGNHGFKCRIPELDR